MIQSEYVGTNAKCPKCGSIILWIATKEGPIMSERVETEILTESGRRVRGHIPHVCPGSSNGGNGTTGIPSITG